MPTTIESPVLPKWADPKEASVFDPLHETLIKRAVSLMGLDDPNTAVISSAMPIVGNISRWGAGMQEAVLRKFDKVLDAAYKAQTPKARKEAGKQVEHWYRKIVGESADTPTPVTKTPRQAYKDTAFERYRGTPTTKNYPVELTSRIVDAGYMLNPAETELLKKAMLAAPQLKKLDGRNAPKTLAEYVVSVRSQLPAGNMAAAMKLRELLSSKPLLQQINKDRPLVTGPRYALKQPTRYTPEQEASIIQALKAGDKSQVDIAKEHNLLTRIVNSIAQRARERGKL